MCMMLLLWQETMSWAMKTTPVSSHYTGEEAFQLWFLHMLH